MESIFGWFNKKQSWASITTGPVTTTVAATRGRLLTVVHLVARLLVFTIGDCRSL